MIDLTNPLPISCDEWVYYLRDEAEEGLGPVIREAVNEDDEPDYKLTRRLMIDYLRAKPSERAIIDRTLTTITGWTLDSLLDKTNIPRKALENFRTQVIDSGGSDF